MNPKDSRGHSQVTESLVHMLRQREISGEFTRHFQKATHVTEGMIKRMDLLGQLQGHTGCVNCLQWSEDGRLLISGSDDTSVIIWDPMRRKQLAVIPTRHTGNIFSVKFLPQTSCSQIVTGAGDTYVTVMNVEYGDSGNGKPVTPILHCRCHSGRVKRIATAPDLADMFWSAGEDGLILQFDLREPHTCVNNHSESGSSNGSQTSTDSRVGGSILIDLCRHAGWHAEAKCISVNPAQPHLIAVGANDAYARLYDRRMLKTSSLESDRGVDFLDREACLARVFVPDESIPHDSCRYYAPAHLGASPALGATSTPTEPTSIDRNYKLATTYVTFSPLGNELLVNLGGDHIYLYDVNDTNKYSQRLQKPDCKHLLAEKESNLSTDNENATPVNSCCSSLSEFPLSEIVNPKEPVSRNNISRSGILTSTPRCSCEYIKRADAFLQRKWFGDFYAAARDYLVALNTKGIHKLNGRRPIIGIVFALVRLKWWKAAATWLALLEENYSKYECEYSWLRGLFKNAAPRTSSDDTVTTSAQEIAWRAAAGDYHTRYVGHCNTTTDIKEVEFVGPTGSFIAAGSDDGALYIWKRDNGSLTTVLRADTSIVNCVQPHPSTCLIATSGIESVVKLWQPLSDSVATNKHRIEDIYQAAEANQERIAMNPFETMMLNLGYEYEAFNPRLQQEIPVVCQTS